jgi:hypothetical protein
LPPEIVAVMVAGEPGHDEPPPLTVTETTDERTMVAEPLTLPLQRESETDVSE